MPLLTPDSHIILAIDVEDKETAYGIIEQCHEYIDAVKVGYPLVLSQDLSIHIIGDIKDKFGLPVIADLKIADVPVTNNKILEAAIGAGADMVTVWGFVGKEPIKECVDIGRDRIGIVVVTELTHACGLDFSAHHAADFAQIAKTVGCYGIQAPGNRPRHISILREVVGNQMIIISCGIGVQGGSLGAAIKAGADFGIIGRAIYENRNPREAASRFAKEVE